MPPDLEQRGRPWRERATAAGIAVASLSLASLAFHPVDAWYLAWVAFVPWMVYHGTRPRRGVALALLIAYYIHFAWTLVWIAEVSVAAVAAIPVLGLPFVLAAALLSDRLVHRYRIPWALAWTVPVVATEWLRDQVLGLTWSSIGYTQWRWLEGVQSAAVFRVHGLSFAVLAVNGAIAAAAVWIWRGRPPEERRGVQVQLGLALGLLGLLQGAGGYRIATAGFEEGPAALGIQISVDPARRRELGSLGTWLEQEAVLERFRPPGADCDLLVISETALHSARLPDLPLPRLLSTPVPGRGGQTLGGFLPRGPGKATVMGYMELSPADTAAGDRDEDGDGFMERNMAGVVVFDGPGDRPVLAAEYAKRVCVPLGEVLPGPRSYPGREWIKGLVHAKGGFVPDLTPGDAWVAARVRLGERERTVGLNICYEMVFPEAFTAQVRLGADFIVNISNDTWYGTGSEQDLVHVAARFRAVESGRSLFRVSNGGISTSVDPLGRYRATVERGGRRKGVDGVLRDRIPVAGGMTPFVRFGEWLAGGPLLGLLLGLPLARRRAAGAREGGRP